MKSLKFVPVFIGSLLILSCNKVDFKETAIDLSSHKLATFSIMKNTKYLVVFALSYSIQTDGKEQN